MKNTRQRGVKASRIKLEHYMSESGIKSQAELARKIADIEGLESEPKDLVNRIFRQNKVEHNSLERIASALNIEAYKLYLTQEDQALITENQKISVTQLSLDNKAKKTIPSKSWTSRFTIILLLAILLAILFNLFLTKPEPERENLSNFKNSLLYPADLSLYPLANYIVEQQNALRIGLVPQALFKDFTLNEEALNKYEVDNVWILEQEDFTRYSLLYIKHFSGGKISTLSSTVLTKNELNQSYKYINSLFNQLIITPHEASSKTEIAENALTIAKARQLTELYFDASNMSQAEELLDKLPVKNAEALATQCLIKVITGWHSNEKDNFKQAQSLCERALMLDSQHPFVLSTNAFRLYRNGQYEDATRAYKMILEQFPNNIEALLGQAELSMRFYLEDPTQNKAALDRAITRSQQAILYEPNYWRSYQLLMNLFYLSKQSKKALEVTKKLIELAPNQLTLANGAILSLCHAQTTEAQKYSEQMLAINASSYIAHETLFFINAYQNQLKEALSAMQSAMQNFQQNQGGLYLQWGQLADAFRWLGDKENAIENYEKALVEYEQDKIKQQTTENDQIYTLYFQAAINQLKGIALSPALYLSLTNLDIDNMPSTNQLKAAILLRWLEKQQEAQALTDKLIKTCPIYSQAVDLKFN